jgi:hypothetical protein
MLRAAPESSTPARHVSGGWSRAAIGSALIAFWWPVAWMQVRPLSDYYFFPLWLGFILLVDGLVVIRTGTSPMQRHGMRTIWFFVASVPLWWLFELFNVFIQNWQYHQPRAYDDLTYALLASLSFSTVIPAVLTMAELIRSFGLDPLRRLPVIRLTAPGLFALHLFGWGMIAAILLWPKFAFPLVWFALIFLLDPILTALRGRSIAWHVGRGDWSPIAHLGIAAFVCGFFWELWNSRALPKWTYDIPYADWQRIFEMPLLGYGGYIPFGIEVYVIYALVQRFFAKRGAPEAIVSSMHDKA